MYVKTICLIGVSILMNSCCLEVFPKENGRNTPPVAVFNIMPQTGTTETKFLFDGSASHDNEDQSSVLQVRWDFENDGIWDTEWSTDKDVNHFFYSPGTYLVSLEVKDTRGLAGAVSIPLTVTTPGKGEPCPGLPYISYWGEVYHTVQIGTQCWLSKNLNVGEMIPGTIEQRMSSIISKYCYNDDPINCDKYGGLYQWDEIMNGDIDPGSQGICPPGWHIPTREDFKILSGWVDTKYDYPNPEWDKWNIQGYDAGYHLQSTQEWKSHNSSEKGGNDTYNFNCLPAGVKTSGSFLNIGHVSFLWTTTIENAPAAYVFKMIGENIVEVDLRYKSDGYSVRCIKD